MDALALAWIKMEKQFRRLFCYLVFQSPDISDTNLDEYVAVLVANRNLYSDSFIRGFDALCPTSLRKLVGDGYDDYLREIERIKRYRNKLLHGQITGVKIKSPQLEKDIKLLRQWVCVVAESCSAAVGYDGFDRNTFRKAKSAERFVVAKYPFTNPRTFEKWLADNIAKP